MREEKTEPFLPYPLHDVRQFQPVLRLDLKRQPVVLKAQVPNREGKAKHCLTEHLREDRRGIGAAEEGFPVVDTGTDFVPYALSKYT
jgi:hypothetical protein